MAAGGEAGTLYETDCPHCGFGMTLSYAASGLGVFLADQYCPKCHRFSFVLVRATSTGCYIEDVAKKYGKDTLSIREAVRSFRTLADHEARGLLRSLRAA